MWECFDHQVANACPSSTPAFLANVNDDKDVDRWYFLKEDNEEEDEEGPYDGVFVRSKRKCRGRRRVGEGRSALPFMANETQRISG